MGKYLNNVEDLTLLIRPADMASVGFHLQRVVGVVDRLFTYASEHLQRHVGQLVVTLKWVTTIN